MGYLKMELSDGCFIVVPDEIEASSPLTSDAFVRTSRAARVSTYNRRLCIKPGDSVSANLTMTKARSGTDTDDTDTPDGVFDDGFKPLSPQEAMQWRQRNPLVSPWRVIRMQAVVACIVVVLVWLVGGKAMAWSAAYGSGAAIFPAVVLARAVHRQMQLKNAGNVFLSFVIWESVKVSLTVVLLLLAPKLVPELNWLALVAGFVVVMKVYWFAAWLQSKAPSPA